LKVVAAYKGDMKGFKDYLRKMRIRLTKDSNSLRGVEDSGNNIHSRWKWKFREWGGR
jgi:hypothetical protein